jgi:mannose-1-phosphate guanylyltransferase/mannose-1-phosphate guanylyltransferase/mannose-6-phosphate isomerase
MVANLSLKQINYDNFDYRPWGYFEVLSGGDNMGFKIKKITVYSNKKLSLQSHNYRKEYWFGLTGNGKALVEDKIFEISKDGNSMVFIDLKEKHRLINDSDNDLEIIEIQLGTYLGEDDIIRYEDDYNRT